MRGMLSGLVLEAVGKPFLCTVLSKRGGVVGSTTHGTVPVANESVGYHERDVVRVGPATTLNSNGNMCQRHSIVTDTNIRPSISTVQVDRDLVGAVSSNLGKVGF